MIKNCPMRHENGNCIPAGGFCTANKNICEALLNAYRMGKAQLSQEGTTSDLISRQAALKALRKCQTYLYDARDPELKIELNSAEAAINNLPTIQPEPHEGHWVEGKIYRDVIECNCSECGQLMTTAATVRMNYCPNCGAHMKGEQDERTD